MRSWTKEKVERAYIEVDVPYKVTGYRNDSGGKSFLEGVCKDLNGLFSEHKDFNGFYANVGVIIKIICIFCGNEYEEMMDEDGNLCCSWCGKGEREAILKKLGEAK